MHGDVDRSGLRQYHKKWTKHSITLVHLKQKKTPSAAIKFEFENISSFDKIKKMVFHPHQYPFKSNKPRNRGD